MIKLKGLTLRNFLSVGNITQSIKFSDNELVLVLGENLDLGGNDNRNGVGKSSIIHALSYVLYGAALTFIRKNNLINKINNKGMLVTIEFEANGTSYKIERGRAPAVFRFIKNGIQVNKQSKEEDDDEAQGENRYTQLEIERIIGMSHVMFKHIVTLNTNTDPFLSLGAASQREIIEQLLGITKLSEKAVVLKKDIGTIKDEIKEEEFKIQAKTEANKRIRKNIEELAVLSTNWEHKKQDKLKKLGDDVEELLLVDIQQEISAHKNNQVYVQHLADVKVLQKDITSLEKEHAALNKQHTVIDKSLHTVQDSYCPTCGQTVDCEMHNKIKKDLEEQNLEVKSKLIDVKSKLVIKNSEMEKLNTIAIEKLDTFYVTIEEAYTHRASLDNLGESLERETNASNPYVQQIQLLEETGIQEVKFDKMNNLNDTLSHQEFLYKLLTNKDSFIRKKIIDQNLAYLNHRLSMYLNKIGLPHVVKFKSDLDVVITLHGRDFDFDNLSRGEKTRLILSLSWSFRDVYENINEPMNLMFIDELVDNGLDTSGVDAALAILKKMTRENNRTIYLISHRDELESRVTSILKVIKENGFTELSTV